VRSSAEPKEDSLRRIVVRHSGMGQQLSFGVPDGLQEAIARRAAAIVAARDRPVPEPWVGVVEAAAHLACKRQRIYDLVHHKDRTRIPHRKEGGRLLFKLSQLDRWLDGGRG
jgi:excisionase family DNA binding protein